MEEEPYPHRELPLTPAIFEWWIIHRFAGQTIRRNDIVSLVPQLHQSMGGIPSNAVSIASAAKKALQNLAQKGLAENAGYRHWRIVAPDSLDAKPSNQLSDTARFNPDGDVLTSKSADEKRLVAERILGSGNGAIYVYYLPEYERRAKEQGGTAWACKIGRTDRDPLERILSQAATTLPERPTIALVLRTPTPQAWENVLHGALTIRGRRIVDSPGTEWFTTSPEEILAIINAIDPDVHEVQKAGMSGLSDDGTP